MTSSRWFGLWACPFALLVCALLAVPVAAQAPLPVHVGGRVLRQADGGLRFGWPAIYFEARFRGTGVRVAVESPTEIFRLLIDGNERQILRRPSSPITIDGLSPGAHVVRLEKMTESQEGGGVFRGFFPRGAGRPLPAPTRARMIEFVGDSFSAGYGDTAPGRTCTRQEVHDYTDTTRAFGPLVAARFDADYRINAYSGFGIVRNYDGAAPNSSLPILYPRLIPDDAADLEGGRGAWRPQLIVISLGANDFSTPLHAGERWANPEALRADYRSHFVAFARLLMARQPQARLLLVGRDLFWDDMVAVAAELNRTARRPVLMLHYGELALMGCDYHPSLADHRALATLIGDAVARIDRLWI